MSLFDPWKTNAEKVPRNLALGFGVIILALFVFNAYRSFDPKLGYSGDSAHYIILGKSIATGQGYANIHEVEKAPHKHFPPGYPLLIALSSPITNFKITSIKRLNQFFLLVALFAAFYLFYRLSSNFLFAFLASVFLAANTHLYGFASQTLSEIPFTLLFLLSIALFLGSKTDKGLRKNFTFWIYLIILNFSIYTRSMGVVVLGASSIVLLQRKHYQYLGAQWIASILIQLPWVIRSQELGGNTYVQQILRKNPYQPQLGQMEWGDWFLRFFENFQRYLAREIPSSLINPIKVSNYKAPIDLNEWLIGTVILGLLILGLTRQKKYRTFLISTVIFYMGILMLWPDVWFGIRFILPLIPILVYLLFQGIKSVFNLLNSFLPGLEKIYRPGYLYPSLIILIIFPYSYYSMSELEKKASETYPSNIKNFIKAAKWVKRNSKMEEPVASIKGGIFHLISDRKICDIKRSEDARKNYDRFRKYKVRHVVVDNIGFSTTKDYLVPVIYAFPENFKLANEYSDPITQIFRFNPDVGYEGEIKDGYREGYGKFVYDRGDVYDGEWKRNLKHGKGKYYFPNRYYLQGTWVRDTLDGWAEFFSPEGKFIERRKYEMNKYIKGEKSKGSD